MKILQRKRKRIAAFISFLMLLLCGCGQQTKTEQEHDWQAEAEAASVSCVNKEAFFICGADAGYFEQNNIGIVSLNSFSVMPVEINRYDHSGQLIEENTGAMQMRNFQNSEKGMTASVMLEPDRGIAHVSVTPNGDATLNLTNAAGHLCCDCLADLASQFHGSVNGVGVVNFSTQRLYVLQESVISFGAGDYYIHCDRDAERGEIDILITYCPLRYNNEA